MVSAAMGRKLDLSGLTHNEAEHVLQVVQRDMRLRKKEEERLSDLRQELDDEGSRCLLLSRQSCFNQRCCIRCCSPFTFLLNPKRQCRDCCYNVCKACRVFSKRDRAWLCSACQKSRLLKAQSLEWFYTNVKSRFKRFGSAKVLKTLYRKHLAEHSALSELTEGSGCEESICNEGSVCGSDSTFYRQAEEHSMADTLTVARRVAEEAIDEAISKAEFNTSTQDSEAQYLRQHRAELIEELAKTIVEKIMSRRKILAEMKADYDADRTLEYIADPHHHHCQAWSQLPVKQHSNLWRSRSAFSLLDNEPLCTMQDPPQTLREGSGSGMTAWLSADCLDNVGVSSVLKSPDGNWIALQSASVSRSSMLTTKLGQVFNTLEKDATVRSAYEGLDSDNESEPEPDSSWGAVLHEIHRKLTDSNLNLRGAGGKASSPSGLGNKEHVFDSEGNWKSNKPPMAALKLKVPAEIRKPFSSRRTSIIDVNFNLKGDGEDEPVDIAEPEEEEFRSSKKQKDPRSLDVLFLQPAHTETPDTVTTGATTPEHLDSEGEAADTEEEVSHVDGQLAETQLLEEGVLCSCMKEEDPKVKSHDGDDKEDGRGEGRRGSTEEDEDEEKSCSMETAVDEDGSENELDEEMRERLYRLVTQSRLAYFSSTDDELNKVSEAEGDGDGSTNMKVDEGSLNQEEYNVGLTYKLRHLEKQVGVTQFSSTEDELDRAGVEAESEEGEHDVELAVKVCRLAYQVNAIQFSSTEDELDRAGRGDDDEEAIDGRSLWKLRAEKALHAVQLRDLASLVSASQFSSTEDELDRVNEDEAGMVREEGASDSSVEMEGVWPDSSERRESIGDIDVNMFDLRGESKGRKDESGDEDDVQGNQSKESLNREIEDPLVDLLNMDEARKENFDQQEAEDKVRLDKSDLVSIISQNAAESEDEGTEFDGIMTSMLMMDSEDMHTGGSRRTEQQQQDVRKQDGVMGVALANCEVSVRSAESASKPSPAECGGEESGSASHEDAQAQQQTWSSLAGKCLTGERSLKFDQEEETGQAPERAQATTEAPNMERSATSSLQECLPSPEEIRNEYSAVSLCSITTEVLKMLNATEELLQGVDRRKDSQPSTSSLPPGVDPKKLDQQFSKLEEHVYVAAGSVYNLEEELSDLEEYARSIHTSTPDLELSFLEEQVAAAAAKVQQSEMKISDISLRIAALKSAGLNVTPQPRVIKKSSKVTSLSVDSSKQTRRRLPAPPVRDKDT